MFLKEMLWKLTMYGKVFNFPTHLGKREILAFPFSTISTAETTTKFLYSKGGTFLLKFRSIFYGQDGKPKRGWRKTKRLDWTPSCPPENNHAKAKTYKQMRLCLKPERGWTGFHKS